MAVGVIKYDGLTFFPVNSFISYLHPGFVSRVIIRDNHTQMCPDDTFKKSFMGGNMLFGVHDGEKSCQEIRYLFQYFGSFRAGFTIFFSLGTKPVEKEGL